MKVRKSLAIILSLVLVFLSIPLQVSAVEDEHIFTHEELACMDYVPAEEYTTNSVDTLIPIKHIENPTKDTTAYYIIECNDGYMLTNPSGTTFSRTRYNSGALQYKKWKFTEDSNGDYIVYSYSNSTKCLTVNPTTKAVSLSTYSSSSNYQKWRMYYSSNGNALKCVSSDSTVNGYKLVISESTLSVSNSTYTPVGFFDVSWYTPTTSISYSNFYLAPQQYKYVYPIKTPSNATLSNNWINWHTSSPAKATVNSDGKVTAVSPGTSYLYFTDRITRVSGMCSVFVTQIANGTYFIKNKQNSQYAKVKNGTMTNGQNVVQYDFDGDAPERWIFTLNTSTGYYSIKSANSGSVSYYMAVSDDSSAIDKPIVIRSATESTLTDGMKWTISTTSSGAYKLKPKTGEGYNYVLCTNTLFGYNNWNLIQSDYVDNGYYKDEWYLIKECDVSLLAVKESYDRSSYFPTIVGYMANTSYNDCYNNHSTIDNGVSKDEMLARMAGSKIVLIRTHGSKTSIETSTSSITTSTFSSLSSNAFDNTELVLYGACLTGKGRNGATNLVNATRSAGVNIVIGFEKSVWSSEVNQWCTVFFESIANGDSVYDSCINADDYVENHWHSSNPDYELTTNTWYINGLSNTVFS